MNSNVFFGMQPFGRQRDIDHAGGCAMSFDELGSILHRRRYGVSSRRKTGSFSWISDPGYPVCCIRIRVGDFQTFKMLCRIWSRLMLELTSFVSIESSHYWKCL